MQHTITEQVSIHPLDNRLNVISNFKDAFAQLEIYYTDKSPKKKVGVINPCNKKQFSYDIGTKINVQETINVNLGCWLTNSVMTPFLKNYISRQHN